MNLLLILCYNFFWFLKWPFISINTSGFRRLFILIFLTLCSTNSCCAHDEKENKPRVSIITSVFKGDKFIKGFMDDIVKSTIFDQCELIIINAASPENEERVIKEY